MNPPAGVEVHEIDTSTVWREPTGVIVSVAKPVPRTVEGSQQQVELIKKLAGPGKKVALLADMTKAKPLTKEVRDYGEEVLPSTLSAFAIFTTSAVGRMTAKLFFGLKKPAYPTEIFKNAEDAKAWLTDYVEH